MRSSIVTSVTLQDQIPKKQLCHEVEIAAGWRGNSLLQARLSGAPQQPISKPFVPENFREIFTHAAPIFERICML
jgi:hypothetical protein